MKRITINLIFWMLFSGIAWAQTTWYANPKSKDFALVNESIDIVHTSIATCDSASVVFKKTDGGQWEIFLYDSTGVNVFKVDSTGILSVAGLVVSDSASVDILTVESWATITGLLTATAGIVSDDSIRVGDNDFVGLGTGKGRMEFDDQATDEINIKDAYLGINNDTPVSELDLVGNQHNTADPGADHTARGDITTLTAGANLVFGETCYMGSDGKLEKTNAAAAATCPALVMAIATINEDATGLVLCRGFVRDDSWDWTVGGLIYLDDSTAGGLTQTAPSDVGDQVVVVGFATHADRMYFNPSYVLVEVTS